MNKLPIEFKQKWAAALRSGDFGQCFGKMSNGVGGFCCLGVASEISGVTARGETIRFEDGYSHEDMDKIPILIVGSSFDNETVHQLTFMNDVQKKSFLEIADYIEANL